MGAETARTCWACVNCAEVSPVYRMRPVRYVVGTEVFACSMHLAMTVEHMAEVGDWVPVTKLAAPLSTSAVA